MRNMSVSTLHKGDYDDNNNNKQSDPDSNIIYGSNSKVTITESNKTYLIPEYIHKNA